MSFSSLMNKKPGISIHNNKGQTLLYLTGGPGEAEIIQEKDLGPDHTSTFNTVNNLDVGAQPAVYGFGGGQ